MFFPYITDTLKYSIDIRSTLQENLWIMTNFSDIKINSHYIVTNLGTNLKTKNYWQLNSYKKL